MCAQRLRIGLPSGSLQDATLELFAKAGFWISSGKRSYKPSVDDSELEIRLLRAQESAVMSSEDSSTAALPAKTG